MAESNTTRSTVVESDKRVSLLQQQVSALTEQLKKLDHHSSEHGNSIARSQGAMGLASIVVPAVFFVGLSAFSAVFWSGMSNNTNKNSTHDVDIAKLDLRIKNFESFQATHVDLDQTIENINTRLTAIETDLTSDEGKFEELQAGMVQLQSVASSSTAQITEHEEELDALEENFGNMGTRVASIQASAGASFVEVETQIRAINEISNINLQSVRGDISLLWQHQRKETYPDKDFYPTDIPAKATTQVGKVNGSH